MPPIDAYPSSSDDIGLSIDPSHSEDEDEEEHEGGLPAEVYIGPRPSIITTLPTNKPVTQQTTQTKATSTPTQFQLIESSSSSSSPNRASRSRHSRSKSSALSSSAEESETSSNSLTSRGVSSRAALSIMRRDPTTTHMNPSTTITPGSNNTKPNGLDESMHNGSTHALGSDWMEVSRSSRSSTAAALAARNALSEDLHDLNLSSSRHSRRSFGLLNSICSGAGVGIGGAGTAGSTGTTGTQPSATVTSTTSTGGVCTHHSHPTQTLDQSRTSSLASFATGYSGEMGLNSSSISSRQGNLRKNRRNLKNILDRRSQKHGGLGGPRTKREHPLDDTALARSYSRSTMAIPRSIVMMPSTSTTNTATTQPLSTSYPPTYHQPIQYHHHHSPQHSNHMHFPSPPQDAMSTSKVNNILEEAAATTAAQEMDLQNTVQNFSRFCSVSSNTSTATGHYSAPPTTSTHVRPPPNNTTIAYHSKYNACSGRSVHSSPSQSPPSDLTDPNQNTAGAAPIIVSTSPYGSPSLMSRPCPQDSNEPPLTLEPMMVVVVPSSTTASNTTSAASYAHRPSVGNDGTTPSNCNFTTSSSYPNEGCDIGNRTINGTSMMLTPPSPSSMHVIVHESSEHGMVLDGYIESTGQHHHQQQAQYTSSTHLPNPQQPQLHHNLNNAAPAVDHLPPTVSTNTPSSHRSTSGVTVTELSLDFDSIENANGPHSLSTSNEGRDCRLNSMIASHQPSTPNTRVSFSTVEIRQYNRILGDNPSCSSGPSLSIDWTYDESKTVVVDVNEFEYSREGRFDDSEMVLGRFEREDLLRTLGYGQKEIAEAIRNNIKIKKQRRQTVNNIGMMKVEMVLERARKSIVPFRKKKKSSKWMYNQWRDHRIIHQPGATLGEDPSISNESSDSTGSELRSSLKSHANTSFTAVTSSDALPSCTSNTTMSEDQSRGSSAHHYSGSASSGSKPMFTIQQSLDSQDENLNGHHDGEEDVDEVGEGIGTSLPRCKVSSQEDKCVKRVGPMLSSGNVQVVPRKPTTSTVENIRLSQ